MESSAFSKFVRGFNPDRFYFWYKLSRKSNNKILKTIASVKYMRIATKCGGYIGRETILHDMPILPHGFHGVHISRDAEIGKNVTIHQNVTITAVSVGDNVMIGANAVLIGKIHIGNNSKIGAGAIVVDDVPDSSTIVSQKAHVVSRPH